ncbi:hypothetical protein BKA70DRAFT_1435221 [Coprinopsis sp. MPI-PUGE-AT-0042]|nr:hypothetical protein BKA70DRAFT_1435221 [Coprinopsis sp. MPI-PUGE-AT-0042]
MQQRIFISEPFRDDSEDESISLPTTTAQRVTTVCGTTGVHAQLPDASSNVLRKSPMGPHTRPIVWLVPEGHTSGTLGKTLVPVKVIVLTVSREPEIESSKPSARTSRTVSSAIGFRRCPDPVLPHLCLTPKPFLCLCICHRPTNHMRFVPPSPSP